VEVRSEEEPSHLCSSPPACEETRALKRGVKPSVRKVQATSPQHEAKSAASLPIARKGAIGSRARSHWAKATEGVKDLEVQPPRTRRRRGRGMVAQRSWELERPVSAPTVRPTGRQPEGGWGATNSISGVPAKGARAERESERPIVARNSGNAGGAKGPYLIEVQAGGTRG
jgi:hypothetical protein